MKTMFGKRYPNCVKKTKKEEVTGGILIQDKEDFTPREIETVDIIKEPNPSRVVRLMRAIRNQSSDW